MDAGLHLSEIPYLCSDMTRTAHKALSPLRGRTYYERLMQEMPYGDANIADLLGWAYVQSIKERVPFDLDARTLREAVGEVDGDILTAALEEAWGWVKEYVVLHRRRVELEERGSGGGVRGGVAPLERVAPGPSYASTAWVGVFYFGGQRRGRCRTRALGGVRAVVARRAIGAMDGGGLGCREADGRRWTVWGSYGGGRWPAVGVGFGRPDWLVWELAFVGFCLPLRYDALRAYRPCHGSRGRTMLGLLMGPCPR